MAVKQVQKDAATYLCKLLKDKGFTVELNEGSKNIVLYFEDRKRRFIIQPQSTRMERRWKGAATEYGPALTGWHLIKSYSTSSFAKKAK